MWYQICLFIVYHKKNPFVTVKPRAARLYFQKLQSHNATLWQNFFVDVGREGFGRKQMSTGLLSDVTDIRDMSGGFKR